MTKPRTERRSLGSAIAPDVSLAEVSALAALTAQRSVEALQASAQRGRRVNTRPKAEASKRGRSRSVEVNDKENDVSNSQQLVVTDLDTKSATGTLKQGPEAVPEPAGPLQATLQALGRRSFGSELQATRLPAESSPAKESKEVQDPKPRRRSRSADRGEVTTAVGSKVPAGLAKKLLAGTSSKRKEEVSPAPLRASPLTPPLDFAPLAVPSPPRGLSPLGGSSPQTEHDDADRLENWLGETVAAATTGKEDLAAGAACDNASPKVVQEAVDSKNDVTIPGLAGSIEPKNAADVLASLLQKQKPVPKQKQKAAPAEPKQPKAAGNRKSLPSGKHREEKDDAKAKLSSRPQAATEKDKKEQAISTFTPSTSSGGATSSKKLLTEHMPPTSPTETRNALIAARERAAAAQQRLEAAEAARRLEEARAHDARRSLLAAQLEIEELERSAGAINDSTLPEAPSARGRSSSTAATPRPVFEACSPQIPEGFTFAPGTPPSELEEAVRKKRAAVSSDTSQPSTFRRRLSSKTSAHLFFSPPLDERDTASGRRRNSKAPETIAKAIVEAPSQPSKGTAQASSRKSKGNLDYPFLVKGNQKEAEHTQTEHLLAKNKLPIKNTTHNTLTEPPDQTQTKKNPKAKPTTELKTMSKTKSPTRPRERKLPKEAKESNEQKYPKKPSQPKQPNVANTIDAKASAAASQTQVQPTGSKRNSTASSVGPASKASVQDVKRRRISQGPTKASSSN